MAPKNTQPTKPRMGRPPKAGVTRDCHLDLRLTSNERAVLQMLADEAGVTASDLARGMIAAAIGKAFAAAKRGR